MIYCIIILLIKGETMKKFLFIFLGLILSACGSEELNIEGKWVEPVPNMSELKQGFDLEQGGKATSIGMATLQYETWKEEDGRLILTGKSIGNHQTIDFTEEYEIASVDENKLVLKNGDYVREFVKCTDCE